MHSRAPIAYHHRIAKAPRRKTVKSVLAIVMQIFALDMNFNRTPFVNAGDFPKIVDSPRFKQFRTRTYDQSLFC